MTKKQQKGSKITKHRGSEVKRELKNAQKQQKVTKNTKKRVKKRVQKTGNPR